VVVPGTPAKYTGLFQAMAVIAKEEGVLALWKGLTPRLLRISKYTTCYKFIHTDHITELVCLECEYVL
jgi:Mitochondrial carrier protein